MSSWWLEPTCRLHRTFNIIQFIHALKNKAPNIFAQIQIERKNILVSGYLYIDCLGGVCRDPDGQWDRVPHRDAQDPDRPVRRDVRLGLQGQQVYAVPQVQLRQEDRAESEHPEGAGQLHDQLDRRQLRLLN